MFLLLLALVSAADDETPIALDALPAAVVAAIQARWPDATLLGAEQERRRFEVDLRTTDGTILEATVTATGRIRRVEDESDEHPEATTPEP